MISKEVKAFTHKVGSTCRNAVEDAQAFLLGDRVVLFGLIKRPNRPLFDWTRFFLEVPLASWIVIGRNSSY